MIHKIIHDEINLKGEFTLVVGSNKTALKKSKELDIGHKLAGNVQQEFKLSMEFMQSSGWGDFLANETSVWIHKSTTKKNPKN